jgi:two-component system, OmpR family, sensor histidine kinase BaeS
MGRCTTLALVALAVGGAVLVGRRWLRPVQEARQAAHRIAEGAFDTRLVPRGHDELAGLALDINTMAGALQRLEASRRRWIAELSHEMRTPLGVLRGEVECLLDGLRPLDTAALQSLHAEVARLTRLVEDFHQLALSDLRALPCSFVPLDARALVQAAVARAASRAQAMGLALSCQMPPAAMPACWDPQRIGQLLDNLLENSLRYTDAPGRIQVELAAAGDAAALLTVDDSAPGVPADSQARLFEPLFRADPSRSRQSGGSGLGLAIGQAIVHSHGGHIAATASPLGGLRIEARLPWQPGAPR